MAADGATKFVFIILSSLALLAKVAADDPERDPSISFSINLKRL